MTDKPVRREFLKTAGAFTALLAIRPFRDGNAFFDVRESVNPTPDGEFLAKTLRTWRPDPALKITGMEISVSEHARFEQNQLTLRIIAETKLAPPLSDGRFAFAALVPINRELLSNPPSDFEKMLHRTLNTAGTFNWVEDGRPIPIS